MSINLEAEQKDLQALVRKVVLKERRILRSSMAFSAVAIVIGLIWVGYSTSRVVNLSRRATELQSKNDELQSANAGLEVSIQTNEDFLRKIESRVLVATGEVSQAKGNGEAVANTALGALSRVQKEVQVAINSKAAIYSKPSQTATPVPRVAVPNLKGLTFSEANKVLMQAGFQVIKTDQDGRGASGTVLYQDPAAGVFVSKGTSVKLYVAKGDARVAVPNVVGLTFAEANQRLFAVGLTVIKADQTGRGIAGTVLYQDPIQGAFVTVGTAVKIYVIALQEK